MNIFVTGIGTDVGKTVVSAMLCEALHADYWKPVQAGSLDNTDSDVVRSLVTNSETAIHPSIYSLKTSASPHAAAELEGITIDPEKFTLPKSERRIVIEGAGGVMVPLNREFLVIDLIQKLGASVVLVSQNYLGSINHSLLTIEALTRRGIPILGIIFNGESVPATESIIKEYSDLLMIAHLDEGLQISKELVADYGRRLLRSLTFITRGAIR